MVKTALTIFFAGVLLAFFGVQLERQVDSATPTTDPQLEVAKRSLAAKRAEIVTSVVTPCKDNVEALAKPEEEHEKNCDCFASEGEREKSLAALQRVRQQAHTRCDLKGLDAQIAYIDQRKAAVRTALQEMVGKFQGHASAFESWGNDAEKGKKEAQEKIGELLVSNSLGAMIGNIIDTNDEELDRRLDEVIKHAESLSDVRRVRTGELKDVVVALRKELAGKSKTEVKQIVLGDLNAAKLALAEAGPVEKRLAKTIIDTNIPRDDEPSAEQKMQSYLESNYATLLTGVEIAAKRGIKDAKIFARASGELALAPDAIDAAAILYNAAAINDNISGLDQLCTAAEQQRNALSAEFSVLVTQRRAIVAERDSVTKGAGL